MAIIVKNSTLKLRRIFHYTPIRTYVANLTDKSIFLPYLGQGGYRLKPLSTETKPLLRDIRLFKTYAVRQRMIAQLYNDSKPDSDGRIIAIGTKAEVQAAIDAAIEAKKTEETPSVDNPETI